MHTCCPTIAILSSCYWKFNLLPKRQQNLHMSSMLTKTKEHYICIHGKLFIYIRHSPYYSEGTIVGWLYNPPKHGTPWITSDPSSFLWSEWTGPCFSTVYSWKHMKMTLDHSRFRVLFLSIIKDNAFTVRKCFCFLTNTALFLVPLSQAIDTSPLTHFLTSYLFPQFPMYLGIVCDTFFFPF